MPISRFVTLLILLFIFLSSTFAQASPPESQTEKDEAREELVKDTLKMVDQAINEIDSLKLWENRSLSLAIAGDLLWDSDQKRAKQLFRNAADELVRGAYLPKEKSKSYYEEYNYWQQRSPRRVVLLMIASRDADLALTLLKETRPPDLQAAIDTQNHPKVKEQNVTPAEISKNRANVYKVREELNLEQQFAVQAAEQDPKKAAALIRESLAKGVSMSAITLIQKIHKKDEDLSKELLGEIITKLLESTFTEGFNSEMQVASYLLNQSDNPQIYKRRNAKFEQIKIEEKDLRSIANKIADFILSQPNNYQTFFTLSQNLEILTKYVPSKAEQIRQKEKEMKKTLPKEMTSFQGTFKKLSDPNTTTEELIAEAKNQNSWQKYQYYKTAIDKSLEKGEGEKVRRLLKSEAESKQRDDALDYLSSKLSEKAIKDDKLEEAENLIDKSETKSAKIKILVNLAIGFEEKNTEESHKTALDLMERASNMVNQFPESNEEVSDIIKVASGFAVVDPARAFPYLENLIAMANDMLTAYALIARYNKRGNTFKDGEIIFTQNVRNSITQYGKEAGLLAKADFDKTLNLIEQFKRQDVRLLAKLLLAQSILKEEIKLEGNRPYNQMIFTD